MKRFLWAMSAALMLAACEKHEEAELNGNVSPVDSTGTMVIDFNFGNYELSPMTRSTLTEAQLTDLWLFDCLDGSLVNTIHQSSTDDGYGSVSLSVDFGEHTFYFVASSGSEPAVDGTTITWDKVKDTFWKSLTLTVSPGVAQSQTVSLQRVATRLRISVNDEVPATLASLVITPAHWYYGIDYTTGEPTDDRNLAKVVNVPSSYIGTTGVVMGIYGLCGSEGFSTDVVVTAKAADESTLAEVSLPDVPLRRNRVTSYSGELFSATRTMTLSVDDEWDDEYVATW